MYQRHVPSRRSQWRCAISPGVVQTGLPAIEIVGFREQTASTTRFEIQTASTIIYMKTNYQPTDLTDSGAILMHDEILLSEEGGERVKIHIFLRLTRWQHALNSESMPPLIATTC